MSDAPQQPSSSSLVPQDLRIDYGRAQLDEEDLAADPFQQFARWFDDARKAGILEANAMTLATADPSGVPSARIVLLKEFDARGFTFHTNYDSRKGRELAANPRAALVIYWQPLERQVRVEGTVQRVTPEESEAYFRTRPPAAQVGAWVSQQSRPITSRAELERLNQELTQKFAGGPVPRPEHWGGLRVVPDAVEFWQGRPSRLHDRLLYTRTDDVRGWKVQRLSP
jgi:pyridoxamine 5'-phosphate oxidase